MVHALLVAYAAITVTLIGGSLYPAEAGYLAGLIRPIAVITAALVIWMAVQTVPLPVKSWAHPIWASAQMALDKPIAGSITIDRGATFVAICRYFSAIAILLVATVVTIDRARAEWVLFWLVGLTSFAAVVQIIHDLTGLKFVDAVTDATIRVSTTALSVLGVIVATAAAMRAVERYETRRARTNMPLQKFVIALSFALAAFSVCALCLAFFTQAPIIFAASTGWATLFILMVVRRLGLGPWTGAAIGAAVIGVAIFIAQRHAGLGDLTLRYASHAQPSLISMTQRIIEDTGWAGTGAGTFASLSPIYQVSDTALAGMQAPTTAAQIAIELGRPVLWLVLIMTIIILFLFFRGALQRGRDAFYPAAGAGCTVALTLESFCDASLLSSTVIICAVATLGLGLAQSISRTSQ